MKVSELERYALDYWVARALGYTSIRALERESNLCQVWGDGWSMEDWCPSENWHQAGPIIEREEIMICKDGIDVWGAICGGIWHPNDESSIAQGGYQGATPLIAAMRAYVASKFGEEVDDAQPQSAG